MDAGSAKRAIRVGLLNFEPIRVTGLCEVLAAGGGFQGRAVDLQDVLRAPDFDLLLVALREFTLTCELVASLRARHSRLRTVVMSPAMPEESVIALIAAGAKGWLDDTAAPEMILQALHVVLRGYIWAPRSTLSLLVDRALQYGGQAPGMRNVRAHFTDREQDVLRQLVLARSNREIAQALSIREQTVKSYIARMMRKTGVGNRIALSMQAAHIEGVSSDES